MEDDEDQLSERGPMSGKFSIEHVPNLFKINYDSKGFSKQIAKHIRKKKKHKEKK